MTDSRQNVSIWRNFGPLIILVLGGSFVYALPYFRYYYYDAFLATFQINNTQMGNLQSAYGVPVAIVAAADGDQSLHFCQARLA